MGNFLTSQATTTDNLNPNNYRLKTNGKNQLIYETKYNSNIDTPFTASIPDRIIYLQTFVSTKCIQIAYDTQQNTAPFSKIRYETSNTTWSTWIDNRGPQGLVGTQGTQGPQGIQGIQGPIGPIGPQGPIGPIGTQGLQGLQGIQGTPGQGLQTLQGLQGTQGLKKVQYEGAPYTSNSNSNGFNFSASSVYTSDWEPFRAFNGVSLSTDPNSWHSQGGVYQNNSTTPYIGSISTTANSIVYKGEWIQVQLPYKIVLQAYEIAIRNILDRCPKSWVVLGSNNLPTSSTINWTVIHENSITTQHTSTEPILYNVSNPTLTSFSLFRIVFLSNFTGGCCINLTQFNLFTSNNIFINGTNFENGRTSITTIGEAKLGDIWLTKDTWKGKPDNDANTSEICNNTTNEQALMIVGNKSAGGTRKIKMWDDVNVNGNLTSNTSVTAFNSGVGSVSIKPGSVGNKAGFIEFRKSDGTRNSYVGYSDDNNNTELRAEGSVGFTTNKNFNVGENLTVGGDLKTATGKSFCIGNTCITEADLLKIKNNSFPSLNVNGDVKANNLITKTDVVFNNDGQDSMIIHNPHDGRGTLFIAKATTNGGTDWNWNTGNIQVRANDVLTKATDVLTKNTLYTLTADNVGTRFGSQNVGYYSDGTIRWATDRLNTSFKLS